jgi:hypothetical protein
MTSVTTVALATVTTASTITIASFVPTANYIPANMYWSPQICVLTAAATVAATVIALDPVFRG